MQTFKEKSTLGDYQKFIGEKTLKNKLNSTKEFTFIIKKVASDYEIFFNGTTPGIHYDTDTVAYKLIGSLLRGHITPKAHMFGLPTKGFIENFINKVFTVKYSHYNNFADFISVDDQFVSRFLTMYKISKGFVWRQLNNIIYNVDNQPNNFEPVHNKSRYRNNIEIGSVILSYRRNINDKFKGVVEAKNAISRYRDTFREELEKIDKVKNAITGSNYDLCDAAHIYNVSWCIEDNLIDDIIDPDNGIFLEPNIHRKFDSYEIFINSNFEFVNLQGDKIYQISNIYQESQERLSFIIKRNDWLLKNNKIGKELYKKLNSFEY